MAVRSSIQNLHAYVPGEQPSSPDVVKLNTNENPYPPSPRVLEALSSLSPEDLRRYPDPSGTELRSALARTHGGSPDNYIVVNGSDEGLALCTRCFCEHGGRVGYMKPSYSLYPVLSDIAELNKVEFPLNEDFSWTVPKNPQVDLFFLTRPNAPTSLSLPAEDVQRLLNRMRGVVVVDEAYAAFAEDSFLRQAGEISNLLVSRTFSKSHSLAGVRVGYLKGPLELISALHKIRDSYNLDALAQRLALAALSDGDYFNEVREKILNTRNRVTRQLRDRGYAVGDSETNFVFARVPDSIQAKTIFQKLKEQEVYVRFFPGGLTDRYLRITVGTDEQMDRFLEILDRIS